MSLSNTSSLMSGERHNMKQFIIAAQEYNKTKADETASLLSRYLQVCVTFFTFIFKHKG